MCNVCMNIRTPDDIMTETNSLGILCFLECFCHWSIFIFVIVSYLSPSGCFARNSARPGATSMEYVVVAVIFHKQSPCTRTLQVRSGPGISSF